MMTAYSLQSHHQNVFMLLVIEIQDAIQMVKEMKIVDKIPNMDKDSRYNIMKKHINRLMRDAVLLHTILRMALQNC